MTQPQQETRLIHCYDIPSFVSEIEKAVKQGFSLDFKKNEHYPVQIGYQFVCTMVKEQVQEIVAQEPDTVNTPVQEPVTPVEAPETTEGTQSTPEVVQAVVEAPKKAGRPAKGK